MGNAGLIKNENNHRNHCGIIHAQLKPKGGVYKVEFLLENVKGGVAPWQSAGKRECHDSAYEPVAEGTLDVSR